MKRWIATGLALLLAGPVHAATEFVDGMPLVQPGSKARPIALLVGGMSDADTSGHALRVNASGSLQVEDVNGPTSVQLIEPNWLSTQFLHISGTLPTGTAIVDSSTAAQVTGYTKLALLVFPTGDDSTWAGTFAGQVRLHYSAQADSQNTFRVVRVQLARDQSAPLAARDTVGSLTYAVAFTATAFDTLAAPDEFVFVVDKVANNPRGFVIPITLPDNLDALGGIYLSFRWRHLNTYNASGLAWGMLNEQRLRLRGDLIGWR